MHKVFFSSVSVKLVIEIDVLLFKLYSKQHFRYRLYTYKKEPPPYQFKELKIIIIKR